MQKHASAMVEEGSVIAEMDLPAVEGDGVALNLTPEEARLVGESITEILQTHRGLEVRVMPRPKELDPRQSFEWTPYILRL